MAYLKKPFVVCIGHPSRHTYRPRLPGAHPPLSNYLQSVPGRDLIGSAGHWVGSFPTMTSALGSPNENPYNVCRVTSDQAWPSVSGSLKSMVFGYPVGLTQPSGMLGTYGHCHPRDWSHELHEDWCCGLVYGRFTLRDLGAGVAGRPDAVALFNEWNAPFISDLRFIVVESQGWDSGCRAIWPNGSNSAARQPSTGYLRFDEGVVKHDPGGDGDPDGSGFASCISYIESNYSPPSSTITDEFTWTGAWPP